jgi:microsomal dipeptidase-like Zn-dependent dipeptidase
MAHLGFGGKLIHGAPDLGILVPAIPSGAGCLHYAPALTRADASLECRAIHEGFGLLDNTCGDTIRKEFIRGLEAELGARVGHQSDGALGHPTFNSFPAHDDLTHQQMWVGWVQRAYQGGLRVMVALAVNNRTLAGAVMGPGDINGDDVASAIVQIDQMRLMVSHHAWMEVARTAADVRRIVGEGRLAVILGVEIDNIGNMQWNPAVQSTGDEASRAFVRSQLQALWDRDVRYVFPVHVVDNKLGGTAIYQDQFNTSNFHQTGQWWDLRCAPASDGIAHEFQPAGFDLAYALIKLKIGIDPFAAPPAPPVCTLPDFAGHANVKDLSPLGEFAIEEMMRKGFLLDVDHMSTRAVQETLSIAEQHGYPVNSGHNGPRMPSWALKNENERSDHDYQRVAALGGMIGLGSGDRATSYVRSYHYVRGLGAAGSQVAIGTDTNGMVLLPGPDPAAHVTYDASFPRLVDGSRTWDLNVDGVANYGLFADYVRSFSSAGMTGEERDAFFSSAEGFAGMWERAEVARAAMIPTPPTAIAGGPYTLSEGGSGTLDASGTTDPNQPPGSLTYEWDFDGDGDYDDASGPAPTYSAGDGPASISVGLRVTDADGMTGTATASLVVQNVAPTATLSQLPPALVFPGMSASLQFTGVADASSADVAAGFEFRLDCTSDGIFDHDWSTASTSSCPYAVGGSFSVTGQVRDKDGGIGTATTTVSVLTVGQAMDAIGAMIESLGASGALNSGQVAALLAKLAEARRLYELGSQEAAAHLAVLRRQVETFGRNGILSAAETAELLFWIDQLALSL